MAKSIDIIIDDVRETRNDVKKILAYQQKMDSRITVLETKESYRNSKSQYLWKGMRHLTSVVAGGLILYIITTFLINQ